MGEKNYEEYSSYLAIRNDWGNQCDLCSHKISEVSRKIELLTSTGLQISADAADVRKLVSRIPELPYLYPEWTGYKADQCYGACTDGELAAAYRDYGETLDSVVRIIESERNRLSIQLEELNSTYINARSNYTYWANRAAFYWK